MTPKKQQLQMDMFEAADSFDEIIQRLADEDPVFGKEAQDEEEA